MNFPSPPIMLTLGLELRAAHHRKLTQKFLAQRAGADGATVQNLKTSVGRLPRLWRSSKFLRTGFVSSRPTFRSGSNGSLVHPPHPRFSEQPCLAHIRSHRAAQPHRTRRISIAPQRHGRHASKRRSNSRTRIRLVLRRCDNVFNHYSASILTIFKVYSYNENNIHATLP
jgi:hypothetical protein